MKGSSIIVALIQLLVMPFFWLLWLFLLRTNVSIMIYYLLPSLTIEQWVIMESFMQNSSYVLWYYSQVTYMSACYIVLLFRFLDVFYLDSLETYGGNNSRGKYELSLSRPHFLSVCSRFRTRICKARLV